MKGDLKMYCVEHSNEFGSETRPFMNFEDAIKSFFELKKKKENKNVSIHYFNQ